MTTRRGAHPLLGAALFFALTSLPILAQALTLQRGPYLQAATPDAITIRWRTDAATDSVVRYGSAPDALVFSTTGSASTREHEVRVQGLQPETRYFYSIGDSTQTLAGADASHNFVTSPPAGAVRPTRIWVLGDSGTADNNARAVRDAYHAFTGSRGTDLWLMLGDNAYNSGTDSEYQAAVFDMYPQTLRQAPLWPTLGNHDGYSADSGTQTGPYYDIFSLPRNAESGGVPSGTEAYYSFDYANIHFVCLDSYDSGRSPTGAMLTWLASDLAATAQDWIVAFWHHPPYSKGSHDSDTEGALIDMRQYALPILESYGVDLVLAGHSHSYERSYLLDGHYGYSSELAQHPELVVDGGNGREDGDGAYDKSGDPGAVYAVAGSSGQTSGGSLNHPAMYISLNTLGSMVLDIEGNRLDATFLTSQGNVSDHFTLIKGPDAVPPALLGADAQGANAVLVELSEPLDAASAENPANYGIDNGVAVSTATLQTDSLSVLLATSPLTKNITYTLAVANVRDLAGNPVEAGAEARFVWRDIYTLDFQDGVAPSAGYAGTRDTYIHEGHNGNNYGADGVLLLDGDDGGGDDVSTLIAWDLSQIPPEATIESAGIHIQVFDPSAGSYGVYQLKRPWEELEATWRDYASGQSWGTDGALGADDRGSELLGSVSSPTVGSYEIELDATGVALVQAWVDGSQPNHGLVISDPSSSDGVDFHSREAASPTARPMLSVTYSVTPDTTAPTPPTGLQVTAVTTNSVSLAWTASDDDRGVSAYDIYRNGSPVGTAGGTAYADAGLSPETAYGYQVVAQDAAGNQSRPSNFVTATTAAEDHEPPTAPTKLQVAAVGSDSVTLSWTASSDNRGVAGYRVFRNGQAVGDIASTGFTDTGLAHLTEYGYYVIAVDTSGNQSAPSNGVTATTEAGCAVSGADGLVLADNKIDWTLTNTGPEPVTIDRIDVVWPAEQGNLKKIKLDGDEIFAQVLPPPSARIESGWHSDVTRRQLEIGQSAALRIELSVKYKLDVEDDYTIVVRFAEGCSVSWAAAPDTEPPTAPANLHQTAASTSSISLAWGASGDNLGVTGYEVRRDGSALGIVLGTAYTDTGLAPETAYDYDVIARDAAGNASTATSLTASTAAEDHQPPTAPSGLQVTGVGPDTVELSWNAATDNQTVAGYRVYRDGQLAGEIGATAFSDRGLTPETAYGYRVTAFDLAGNESQPSDEVTGVTGPAPTCAVDPAANLILGDNKIEWDLANLGPGTVTIDRIEVSWPAEQGHLKRVKLDGSEIYSLQQPPPEAVIDSGWNSNLSRREIPAGDTERLKIEFTVRYKGDAQEDYAVTVHFAEGCAARF